MLTILIQIIGVGVFMCITWVLGKRIRREATRQTASQTLRINQWLSWTCLLIPGVVGMVYPGLTRYDALLGISPLPFRIVTMVAGSTTLLIGLYLLVPSQRRITDRLKRTAHYARHRMAREGLCQRVRHPRSLGCYLACIGTGLFLGSTSITLASLMVVAPLHLFNLRFVEEHTREVLYGSAYAAYRRNVPFLIPKRQVPGNLRSP